MVLISVACVSVFSNLISCYYWNSFFSYPHALFFDCWYIFYVVMSVLYFIYFTFLVVLTVVSLYVWSYVFPGFLLVCRVVFLKPSLVVAFEVVSLEISLDSGAR